MIPVPRVSRPALGMLAVLATTAAAQPALAPPVAKKDPKTMVLHGETLVDDYHWLRNKNTPEVEAHLRAELAYAEAFMRPTEALQQRLYDEMLGRIQQTDTNVPYRDRGYFYYSRTEEGKQYPIYARRKGSLEAPEEVLVDVNRLAEGRKFMSLGALAVSPDGQMLAYTTDETGFRQYRLHLKDLRTGDLRPETAERVTAVEWSEDGRTLLYGVEHPQTKRSYQVFRHALGEKEPALVYEEKDERFNAWVWKSRDRRWLFIEAGSHTTSEARFAPAGQPAGPWKVVSAREQDHQYDVESHGDTLWIRTNDKGRNFRLVTVPAADPGRAGWKEVVAHRDDVMLAAHWLFRDFHVVLEREAGFPRLRVTDIRTGQSHRIEVPEEAAHITPSNNREFDAPLFRFAYESPITSTSIFDYDPRTRERKLLKQEAVLGGYDPARYRVEVRHASAADGVKVPLWLLYRKDLKLDGTNPAFLTAYGSYGSASSATFSSNRFSLVDRGVVYATAYIRGGGELGKRWHDEGRMLRKKNTFTDFIAVAEHLVASRYTSSDRLAISGGSAGGLLMGAVMNMRPDLFKVVVAHVPFVDVINTMMDETLPLTVAEFEEWGNPRIEEQYRYMRGYSPYDNVAAKAYPTLLVKTSYNDSQVMYWEPAKWVAKLRATKTDRNPLVFHVNMEPAGHSGRSGRYNRLREIAFDYAFVLWQLGVEKVEGAAGPAAKPPTMADVLAAATASDWRPLSPEDTLYLDLPGGRVVMELVPAFAPRHAGNIKALVREGYFDGLAVVRVQDNYVTQWGDPDSDDEKKRRPVRKAQRTLPAEFAVPWKDSIPFTVLPDQDGYAPVVGFSQGHHAWRDPAEGTAGLAHCYGTLGVGRGNEADSGGGTSLYAVIGHGPRHLDRNITVVGRVVHGMERLSSLPRGTGNLGFYEKPGQRIPITAMRVAADVPAAERMPLEVLRTDTPAFARLVESRRNRREEWYKRPAGHVELCNVPIPVRLSPAP